MSKFEQEVTEKTELREWSESEPWEYHDRYKEYEITGELAEKIQQRAGVKGKVTAVDLDWSYGTCEACGSDGNSLTVRVDGEEVFRANQTDDGEYDENWDRQPPSMPNCYAQFLLWLAEDA